MLSVQLDKMDIFSMKLRRIDNLYRNSIIFNNLNQGIKRILANNVKYKGKYTGKRCFILGNAPSVNKIDFKKLQSEVTFTVNDMILHKDFLNLNSSFHFIADPYYLNLKKGNSLDANIIRKMLLLAENETVLFLPIQGENTVKKYGWHKKIDIRYFYSNLSFYDNYKEQIDFTRFIPGFYNVIHWCIIFAIYLGCNELYLLGCDFSNLAVDILLCSGKKTELQYAFDYSKGDTEYVKKIHGGYGLEYTLYGYFRMIHDFSELKRFCQRHGVNLYNCSQETILDNIPKRNIGDIL